MTIEICVLNMWCVCPSLSIFTSLANSINKQTFTIRWFMHLLDYVWLLCSSLGGCSLKVLQHEQKEHLKSSVTGRLLQF